jgi:diguanylate cyclase (GGDEF)-like protein
MNIINLNNYSIRTRFIVSIIVIFLPIIMLTGVFIYAHEAVIVSLDEIVEETTEEMHPVMVLQNMLLMVTMAPHDYMLSGEQSERAKFDELSGKLDSAFEEALTAPFKLEEEHELIMSANNEWLTARELGKEMFSSSVGSGNRPDVQLMKKFDLHIDRSVEMLDITHETVMREMKELLAGERIVKRNVYLFVAVVFIIGVGLLIVTSIRLPRSILSPLRALEKTTEDLAEGDLSSRALLGGTDEIGKLAEAFNLMAARLENSQAALEELAAHDPLTDIFNRREFYRRLEVEIKRSLRYERIFSLVMLDLDNFKAVNDIYGHQAGDRVLKTVALVISKEVRPGDVFARYGGDEFGLILPETSIPSALKLTERIRTAVSRHTIELGAGKKVNISSGLAGFPDDATTSNELVSVADKSLYSVKKPKDSP